MTTRDSEYFINEYSKYYGRNKADYSLSDLPSGHNWENDLDFTHPVVLQKCAKCSQRVVISFFRGQQRSLHWFPAGMDGVPLVSCSTAVMRKALL